MIDLPTALELNDDSRLTSIVITPYAHENTGDAGAFVLHRILFDDDVAPTEAIGATSAFLPATVMTLAGVEADGSPWGATVQMQPQTTEAQEPDDDRPFPHALWEVTTAAVDRAQDLTGISGDFVRYVFDESDIARRFEADDADPAGWSAINLLVGLTIGMATATDLEALTDAVDAPGLAYDDRTEHVAYALHQHLLDWSANYEGPEQ